MALAERAAGVGPVTMHGYSKNRCRRIESGARGCPARRVRVYPRLSGAATKCARERASSENGGKVKK
jgi:hypothetical protein